MFEYAHRRDLRIRLARGKRFALTMIGLVCVGLLATFFVGAVVAEALNKSDIPANSPWRLLAVVLMFAPVIAGVALLGWSAERSWPKCPRCRHPFSAGNAAALAIVSGRCGHCGQTLFDGDKASEAEEPFNLETSRPRLSRAELDGARIVARQAAWRQARVWGVAGAVLLLAAMLGAETVRNWSLRQFGDIWGHLVMPFLAVPGFAVGFWSLVTLNKRSSVPCACPACGENLSSGDYSSKTGNCSGCGGAVFADPFPGLGAPPPSTTPIRWSVEDFRQRAQPVHDRLWLGCFVGVPFTLVWGFGLFSLLVPGRSVASTPFEVFVFVLSMAGVGFFQIGGVFLWHGMAERQFRCPACQEELLSFYQLVIASRRCYHCGEVVLKSSSTSRVAGLPRESTTAADLSESPPLRPG